MRAWVAWTVLLGMLGTGMLAGFQQGPATATVVISNVTVVDATGGPPLPASTVMIAGDRIAEIKQGSPATIPAGASVIDGTGRFLIPGLWDMHAHLSWTRSSALPALLANGVTGVRDMGGRLREIDEWRSRIDTGVLAGPRIARAGPVLNGQSFNFHQFVVSNEAEARGAARALHLAGVDFIKIHRRLPRVAYFALIDECRKLGLDVTGHIPMTVEPAEAADAGHASVEHVETLFEGTFASKAREGKAPTSVAEFVTSGAAALFARFSKNGTAFDPTLVAFRSGTRLPDYDADPLDRFIAKSAKEMSARQMEKYREAMTGPVLEQRRRQFAEMKKLIPIARDAGVVLLAGTDIAARGITPGFSLHDELELLVEAGLSPLQALQAATRNPAQVLKRKEQGTVQAGGIADLVLLDANPMDDIRNTRRIRAVIFGGRVLDRAALDRLLAEAEQAASAN